MANSNNAEQQQDSEPFPTLPSVAGPPPSTQAPAAPSAQVRSSSQPSQVQNGQYRMRRTPIATPICRPSVRIRRTSSARTIPTIAGNSTQLQSPSHVLSSSTPTQQSDGVEDNRRRSSSEPQRPGWVVMMGTTLARSTTGGAAQGTQLPCVVEEVSGHEAGTLAPPQTAATANLAPPTPGPDSVMRRLSVGARSAWRRRSTIKQQEEEIDPEIVDWLDVVGEYICIIHLNTAC